MKHINLLFLFISFLSLPVAAQEWTIAPEGGINYSNLNASLHIKDGYKYISGAKAGLVANLPFSETFFLQPGLFFSQKGYELSGATYRFNYLELPLNLLYRLDLKKAGKLFASAGLYAAYAVGGSYSSEDGTTEVRQQISYGNDSAETKPFDIGAQAGIGYETPLHFYVRAQYGLGFAPMYYNSSLKNCGFQFTIGYLIGRH